MGTTKRKRKPQTPTQEVLISAFLKSRRAGLSPRTLEFYSGYLRRAREVVGVEVDSESIRRFLSRVQCSSGGRHAYFRVLRAFYGWLFSQKSGYGLEPEENPMLSIEPPKVTRKLLPTLTEQDIHRLLSQASSARDRAIISLAADSGLRLSELAAIRLDDIDWERRLVKVTCKGAKEALAPFGPHTSRFLKQWFDIYSPNGGSIWGLRARGIQAMLSRLEARTGVKCNCHTLRRSFATILARRGVDALHIMRLGRWESLAMVDRYTKALSFDDALRHYTEIVLPPQPGIREAR